MMEIINMINIIDINGKVVKKGDTVVFGNSYSATSCFLKIGVVTNIVYHPKKTIATIEVKKDGRNSYGNEDKSPRYFEVFNFKVPRCHDNIIVL